MSKFILIPMLLLSINSFALVSSPITINSGESALSIRLTREGGFIKPSQNPDSFQKANNVIASLTYSKAVESSFKDLILRAEYRRIETPQEKVDGKVYYEANSGNQLIIGGSFNFVHTLDKTLGLYINISPVIDVNEDKFALPRADVLQVGISSGFNLTPSVFTESHFHLGSGIPGDQNMYALFNISFGLRRGATTYKLGPYAEADLEERAELNYNSDFNTNERSEKIKLYKVGFLAQVIHKINENSGLDVSYLQKAFGQYLPSTNALSLNYIYKF